MSKKKFTILSFSQIKEFSKCGILKLYDLYIFWVSVSSCFRDNNIITEKRIIPISKLQIIFRSNSISSIFLVNMSNPGICKHFIDKCSITWADGTSNYEYRLQYVNDGSIFYNSIIGQKIYH